MSAASATRGAAERTPREEYAPPFAAKAERALRTRWRSASVAQILDFTILLAAMLESGVSITAALEAAYQDVADRGTSRNRRWLDVIAGIRDHVEAGGTLSAGFARYPDFSDTFVEMVRAGEMSGKLPEMLDRVGGFIEADADTRAAVKGALIYPACMFVIAMGCVTFLLVYIFPKFAEVFRGHEELLPWPTKFFFWLSDFLREDWYLALLGIAATAGGALYLRTLRPVRRWLDGVKLDIPVVSYVVRSYVLCRTLKTMGILLESGVVILDVIRIVRDVSENVHYSEVWDEVAVDVMNGNPLTEGIGKSPLFPSSTVQIIAAGERTGKTGPMLIRIADRMEKDLNRAIKALTTLIEPVMIVFMGVLVGMISASLMLPLFRMSQMVK